MLKAPNKMVNFQEHFWGDKYNGFDVLHHNFKHSLNASKEFGEFLKERSSIEETYSKSLLKLANKCSASNGSVGVFEPCWRFLQGSTEKLANVHNQIIQHLNDVSKAVREYGEQQKEKQKQLKDDFSTTTEAVLSLHKFNGALTQAKEAYQQRSAEVEKCRKDVTSLKDIKTAEGKYKKSTEEYKNSVEKREHARKEYQEKMTEIYQKLHTVEEAHLKQMLELLSKYGESIKAERFLLEQIIEEFGRNMVALTVEKLLQQFVNLKQTGKEIPVPIDFEEVQLETQPVDLDAVAQALKEEKQKRKKEKREKRAERKTKKKEKSVSNGSVEKVEEETDPQQPPIELDEEGYVIRRNSIHSKNSEKDSDSDFDSDSDDEQQKIQVRIKPVTESKQGSDADLTDEQFKKLTTTLTLMSPASVQQKMALQKEEKKTWGSQGNLTKLSAKSRSNNDLLGLDKNADTASIHSLPMNSSIPCLDLVPQTASSDNNIGAGLSFDASLTSSPISSPVHNSKGDMPGSTNMSPAESMDQSVDSFLRDDAPPPLPMKTWTMSNQSQSEQQGSVSNSSESLNLKTSTEEAKESAISAPEIKMFSNKLFMDENVEKSKSLPMGMRGFGSLEPIKPPPSEKRTSATLRPLSAVNKSVSGGSTSVPRPKPGQLVAPPPSSGTSRRNNMPQAAASSSNNNTAVNSNSSLSDLLDINFCATAPTLTPATSDKENTTSHWINPELTSDIPSESNNAPTSTNAPFPSSSTDLTSSTSSIQPPMIPPKSNNTENAQVTSSDGVPKPKTSTSSLSGVNSKQASGVVSFEANTTPPVIPKRTVTGMLAPANSSSSTQLNQTPSTDRAIPIAVAFIETINGVFKGTDDKSCMIRVTGDMTISFPANIITMLSNNTSPPVLSFLVNGTSSLEQIFPNKALVERGGQLPGGEGMTFKFNMAALAAYLKKQSEQGAKASYYNIDILKYQVRCTGLSSAPLQLSAYWRCDTEQTDLKIDYKYNASAMSAPVALNNVSVVVPIDGGVTIMQSKPTAIWSSEHQRCMWKLAAISSNIDDGGCNALRARFDITQGPTTCVPVAVQFTGEGSIISSLNFDLTSNAYKLSLVKKRFASGKYIVESSAT